MPRSLRTSAGAALLVAAVAAFVVLMPRVTHTTWDSTEDLLGSVSLRLLGLITVVWALGLTCHTTVLRGALPGLSIRRAWALNLGGSSVSNVLPFGGAAGIGLNYAMLRSWGYDRRSIAVFATLSNTVVAVVKVAIAAAGLLALSRIPALGHYVSLGHGDSWVWPAAAGALLAAGVLVARRSRRLAGVWTRWVATLRQCGDVARRGWAWFAVGGLSYPLSQLVLLMLCLRAVGLGLPIAAVAATYAVERLVGVIPLTPGGVGLVETAATATLVGFGADPSRAIAGVLLFRVFTYLIEIPLGAVVTFGWAHARRRRQAVQTAA